MMFRLCSTLLALVTIAFLGCSKQQPAKSPYSGQESRAVKSLSDSEIRGLLDGAGLGYAKVAELNGFPGPKHVLELADDLALTAQQKAETRALFDSMNARARELGARLVDAETSLDAIFAGGSKGGVMVQCFASSTSTSPMLFPTSHVLSELTSAIFVSDHLFGGYVFSCTLTKDSLSTFAGH